MSDTDGVIESDVSTDSNATRRLTWETRVMQASPLGVMATSVVIAVFVFDKSANATSHLTALLALEARIENVREWPLDLSTVVRFAFYLALPLGSWLGGALVERGLDLATR